MSMSDSFQDGVHNVIPLSPANEVVPLEERNEMMRVAVVQAVTDLVIRRVPPDRRSAYFDAARDLLDRAGWSLTELIEAADPGPEQEALFRELGLR